MLRETLVGIGRDAAARTDTTDLHHARVDATEARDAKRAASVTERLLDADAADLKRALDRRV